MERTRRKMSLTGRTLPLGAALGAALMTIAAEPTSAGLPAHAPLASIAPRHADFVAEVAAPDVRHVADWAVDSGDHENLPFIIIDKRAARVYAFSARGRLQGAAPVLLGRAVGDEFAAGVADMDMYETHPWQRITPAGRFRAESFRKPNGQWILWVDYDAAIALHKVLLTNPAEERDTRIRSTSADQRRITYGCINVPVEFYDAVIHPTFRRSHGIVYVLPETRSAQEVFGSYPVAPAAHDSNVTVAMLASEQLAQQRAPDSRNQPRAPRPADRRGTMKVLPPDRRSIGSPLDASDINA